MNDSKPGLGFWVSLVFGWVMISVGIALLVTTGGVGRMFDVGLWVVGLDLAHDLLLAPIATVVAVAVVAVLPARLRAPVLAGLGASAVVLLLAWPLLGGYGRRADNDTILPRNYSTAVALVLAVIWALAGVWFLVRLVHSRVNPKSARLIPHDGHAPGD